MATAAFRSTEGRSAVRSGAPSAADAGSSNRSGPHRRSRSLSRHSGRFRPPAPEPDELPTCRGRFVHGVRDSESTEISLDDLADEFFRARAESEEEDSQPAAARSRRRLSVAGYRMETESSRQRGRSVSRPPDHRTEPLKGISDSVLRRRRSVSVARHPRGDSEDDINSLSSRTRVKSQTPGNGKLQQPSSNKPMKAGDVLKRSRSQKDLFHSRNSYMAEKCKQNLLTELAVEVEPGHELSNLIKDFLPFAEKSAAPERQSRSTRRSKDRSSMTKHLTTEAEKYFEDFLSNVEETDISSFDGERSDTSSNIRCLGLHNSSAEIHENEPRTTSLPVHADDVLLPWLQWETSTDPSPSCQSKTQEASTGFNNCNQTASSFGNWSPEGNECSSTASSVTNRSKFGLESHLCRSDGSRRRVSSFDMDEYMKLKQSDDLLFEMLRQRLRIDSGGMILCGRILS
ncbi:hypothetical protein Cni_G01647 [Canna indica]|uniref:Uncharacterized protein n=1 Tax=Canna indica TaxID=4628 RepID=A0AAQ3PYK2_9LILI|nr:hypothetical protein Cni_G01647 [Canna indica]